MGSRSQSGASVFPSEGLALPVFHSRVLIRLRDPILVGRLALSYSIFRWYAAHNNYRLAISNTNWLITHPSIHPMSTIPRTSASCQSPPRFIRTHIKHVDRAATSCPISSIVTLVLLAVSLLVIVSSLALGAVRPDDQSPPHKQVSSMIASLNSDSHSRHLPHLLSTPAIPLVLARDEHCEKSKLDLLEESMRNVKIFSMLRTKFPSSAYSRTSFFTSIKPLFAVQHPKFTSSCVRAEISPLSFSYWNPFAENTLLEYEGVN